MDASSSFSWFSWMSRSTIHERNVARRHRTMQISPDTRPTLIRIASVVTSPQSTRSNHGLVTLKHFSSGANVSCSALEKIVSNPRFDEDISVLTYEYVNKHVASSATPNPFSSSFFFALAPVALATAGIMGSWTILRSTNALPWSHKSSPLGYALLAPSHAPNLGIPIPILRQSHETISGRLSPSWNKLSTLLMCSMQSSWKSSQKSRIPLLVVLLASYEVVTSAVLGPRSSPEKRKSS